MITSIDGTTVGTLASSSVVSPLSVPDSDGVSLSRIIKHILEIHIYLYM